MYANADGLSRLLLTQSQVPNTDEASVFNIEQLHALPVQATEVAAATHSDPQLSKFLICLRPQEVSESLCPFARSREELTLEGDCSLRGMRVVIPVKLCLRVLEELHQGNAGVVRMKLLAHSHVWWPNIDREIEKIAKCYTRMLQPKHHCTPGPGLRLHGSVYMWILWSLSWVKCCS